MKHLVVSRLKAAKCFNALATDGVVKMQKMGRSNYYVNVAPNRILLDQREGQA